MTIKNRARAWSRVPFDAFHLLRAGGFGLGLGLGLGFGFGFGFGLGFGLGLGISPITNHRLPITSYLLPTSPHPLQ